MRQRNPLDIFVSCFLHFLGSRFPLFFDEMIREFDISEKQRILLNYWYVDKVKTESIGLLPNVNLCERQVFNLHKDFIDKFKSIRKPKKNFS